MDYRQAARDAASRYGIDPDMFLRLIQQESSFRPDVVSPKGAIGLGQLMPATAKELGVDPTDPMQNLEGAAKYLSQQLKRFGDPSLALAAYNAGPTRVAKLGRVPNIAETQNYVKTILGEGQTTMATPMDMAREEELRLQMLASGTAPQAAPRAPLSALMQDRPQAAAAPQQRRSGFGGIMDYLGTPSPTTGLSRAEQFAAALDPLIMPQMRSGEAIRARGAQRQAAATKNKTVEYLRRMGYNDYADAVESGAIGSKEIMNALMSKKMGGAGAVRSTKQFSNGTVVQSTDTGVVVYNPQGKVVTGDEAQKVINAANEYELSYAQRLSGGRKLGGISVEAAQDAFEKISLVNNSITNIESALDALEQGAQSGMIYNMIPNVTLASGQLETAMNNMGLDVISSVTFGALSEGEMRLAMETAVPRNLPPEELKKYLQNKKSAQIKAKAALTKAATYLSNPANSLNTWLQEQASRPTPKVEDGQVKVWNQSLNNGAGGFE
jgi:hypothetical protein